MVVQPINKNRIHFLDVIDSASGFNLVTLKLKKAFRTEGRGLKFKPGLEPSSFTKFMCKILPLALL